MIYVEVPNVCVENKNSLFLAGGIVGCPDWQSKIVNKLLDLDIIIYNPRRKIFPINDPSAAEKQIKWEYDMLRKADIISFWFCKETMCPIVLFELGAWTMTGKPIVVGVDPEYKRRKDVEIQTKLARPCVPIVYDLDSLCNEIFKLSNQINFI